MYCVLYPVALFDNRNVCSLSIDAQIWETYLMTHPYLTLNLIIVFRVLGSKVVWNMLLICVMCKIYHNAVNSIHGKLFRYIDSTIIL